MEKSHNVHVVEDGGQPFQTVVKLNSNHSMMEVVIRDNTLNDTAIYGGSFKIAPGWTGSLYKADCFLDSMWLNYAPYKATEGRLVIEYFTRPY